MAQSRHLTVVLLMLASALASALALDVRQWFQNRDFNTALMQGDLLTAAGHRSAYGRSIAAVLQQQQGDYQSAIEIHAELIATGPAELRGNARYNLGNTYLQQGLAAGGERDLALPLFELAKETYRQRLRDSSQDWDAKYNLERSLQLAPDPRFEPPPEWQVPEHSQRANIVEDKGLQGLP